MEIIKFRSEEETKGIVVTYLNVNRNEIAFIIIAVIVSHNLPNSLLDRYRVPEHIINIIR